MTSFYFLIFGFVRDGMRGIRGLYFYDVFFDTSIYLIVKRHSFIITYFCINLLALVMTYAATYLLIYSSLVFLDVILVLS